MVSQRAINDIMQTPYKEVHFFFFSLCCIFLIALDSLIKFLENIFILVTDDGLYERKAFYKVKIAFIHPLRFIQSFGNV